MTVIAAIGAGAAALAASRHLLSCGLQPCIFEGSARLGGAWNSGNGNGVDKMWDAFRPNLSKHTCQFSEMPFSADNNSHHSPTALRSRQDVLQYLEPYATNFVDPQCFRFGCTVTHVKQSSSSTDAATFTATTTPTIQQRYQVEWHEPNGVAKSEEFDGVIVATGFFAAPAVLEGSMALYNNNDDDYNSSDVNEDSSSSSSSSLLHDNQDNKVIHSAHSKSPEVFADQTVAVVGASFSALEIAADIRKRATRVVSIVPHIPWVLPRYVPMPTTSESSDEDRDKFVPHDVVLYRRNDPEASQTPPALHMDEAVCRQKHGLLQSLAGTRTQAALGISADDYLNLAVDGNIDVVHGRVESATTTINDNDGNDKLAIALQDGQILTDIDRVITCTGYKSRLDFLDDNRLPMLEYDAADGYAPLTPSHTRRRISADKTRARIRGQQCNHHHRHRASPNQGFLPTVRTPTTRLFARKTSTAQKEEQEDETTPRKKAASTKNKSKSVSRKKTSMHPKDIDNGDTKKTTKRAAKKRKSKSGDERFHWTKASDPFALVVNTTRVGPKVLDKQLLQTLVVVDNDDGTALVHNNDGDDLVITNNKSQVMSVALTIRGNPLPLRRHRTSRGFVYNPSAKAQASFRNQTSMLVFGRPDDEVVTANDNTTTTATPFPFLPPLFPAQASLAVTLILHLRRPLNHFKSSKRETCTLKASAPSSLTSVTRTDADNLAKFVLDACNGLLYDDDRQIQSLHVIKQLDNQDECLGATQLFIRTIDDSMEQDILRHAMQPYLLLGEEEANQNPRG